MFNPKRVPILELERLLSEGKSQTEIAKILGVSKQAVSKRIRRKRELSLTGGAPPHKYSLDGLGPFKAMLDNVLSEIRHLNTKIKQSEGEVRDRLNIQRLKYCAEARKEFELALEIDEKRFNIEEVLRLRDFVIEKIGEVDEETRNEIVANLKRGHALRRVLSGS